MQSSDYVGRVLLVSSASTERSLLLISTGMIVKKRLDVDRLLGFVATGKL